MLEIETVAVMGATDAGAACAVLASLAGCAVRLHDAGPGGLERAFEAVRRRAELAYAAGVVTRHERQRILDGVLFTADLDEAVTAADLVVDAATARGGEWLPPLGALLRATAAVAAAGAALPGELAAGLPQPGRVLALRLADAHGPVPRLEVFGADGTSVHVLSCAREFAVRVNRAARTGGGGP